MKIIDIVKIGGAVMPAQPLPKNALRIIHDGARYIIYEDGDTLPVADEPSQNDKMLAAIDNELASLDALLPRSVEDLALALNISLDLLPQQQRMLYSRKAELRQQRKQLKDGKHGLNRKN